MKDFIVTNNPEDIATELSAAACSLQSFALLLLNDKSKTLDGDSIGYTLIGTASHIERLAQIVETLNPATEGE